MPDQETQEALAAFIDDVLDGDAGTNVGPGLAAAILYRFAVTPKDETEWEYRAEGRNRMGHMEMRNRVEAGVIPSLVRRGYVAYRRRPAVPAGLWEPVPEEAADA